MSTSVVYQVGKDRLDAARGALMVALGRDVSWQEFADLADLSVHTVSGIRHGRSRGGATTLQRIVAMLRRHGVNLTTEDLLIPSV